MSNIGVHDFAIPHEFAEPLRDIVLIRLPLPPKVVGSLQIPDMYRDMAVHNVMVGRVVAMGPLAFVYKDADGKFAKSNVQIGDWVEFRPYAGTQTMGGKVAGAGNWRYLSTFQDAIAKIPADKMPDPATLLWDEAQDGTATPGPKPTESFGGEPRERVKVTNAVR
jgi:co-chaperonin GroES (HSP10)